MGDAAGEPSDGLDLLRLAQLLFALPQRLLRLPPLGDVVPVDHQAAHHLVVEEVAHAPVEPAPGAVLVPEANADEGDLSRRRTGLLEAGDSGRDVFLVEEVERNLPDQLLDAIAEDRVGVGAHVAEAVVLVDDGDGVERVLDHRAEVSLARRHGLGRTPQLVVLAGAEHRSREHVGDRLQEVDVLDGILARVAVARGQATDGAAAGPQRDGDAALRPHGVEQVRAAEARLPREIGDDHRSARAAQERAERTRRDGHRLHRRKESVRRCDLRAVAVGADDRRDRDLQVRAQRLQRLREEIGQREPGKRKDAEARHVGLLARSAIELAAGGREIGRHLGFVRDHAFGKSARLPLA